MPSPRLPAQPDSPPTPDLPPVAFVARELRLPAEASELHRAREYADRAATTFGFGEDERFDVVFAVNEAVTNAIRHGTADEAGTIGLRIAADGDRMTLEVCDRGPFVPPGADDEPMSDHGRGFALMTKLMDDVEVRVRPDGTTVRLGKCRRGVGNRAALGRG
jgi:serine/threonine-protein kinase RsbW